MIKGRKPTSLAPQSPFFFLWTAAQVTNNHAFNDIKVLLSGFDARVNSSPQTRERKFMTSDIFHFWSILEADDVMTPNT